MRHLVLTRSAYGPGWDPEANARRLALTRAITIPSLLGQTDRRSEWVVLLHRDDALLRERRDAYAAAGARFIYTDGTGSAARVAVDAYRAGWAEAIGPRDEVVAMTRLDDDDALAPWVVERIRFRAPRFGRRTALVFPLGIRVWGGCFTAVRHESNAMQTLITLPGDLMTVYDYGHRFVRKHAAVVRGDARYAWLWSRHPDTLSGWHNAERPLVPAVRALFPVDWSVFGEPIRDPSTTSRIGRAFR
jgi:hypothetical protein